MVGAGCGSNSPAKHPARDAADGPHDGGATVSTDTRDAPADTPAADAGCKSDALTKRANGQACTCAADCTSNFCVDGLCCNDPCTNACKTCGASGSMGVCTFVTAGSKPRDATTCPTADTSTCGFDGTCDGAGACRKYTAGTLCGKGMCDGEAVVGARSCDGLGRCRPGPTVICAPYSCDTTTGACFDACSQTSQCASGQQCVSASCGKKMKGATCKVGTDCASGFCADGVCCNVACAGGCVSCALPGRLGTCWPIDQGVPDPRAVCKDQGQASCGATGACDGFGGCEKYAPETQCIAPSCTGTRRNTPGTCDGLGTCRPQGVQNCSPFACVDGACNKVCLSDADCEMGHACVKGLCGPKQNGQPCGAGTECLSTHCVDGVCCDTACPGACHSCSLASAPGKCTSVAAGNADPRGVCQDLTAAACSTNGKCDGAGGCQKYKMGTLCAPESCAANVYTPPSTCSSTGQCVAPDALPCSPYVCNATSCFNACTPTGNNCLSQYVCNGNSCGLKNNGASCSAGSECGSTFCAQGVCCDKACTGACQSCAMSGTLGACTNVTTGAADPAGICQDQGGASCGTNGKCQAGACQKYAKGTPCMDSTCPAGTTNFTPGSACDGNGACETPAASSCFPFSCGTKVCKVACTADGDCASPAICFAGSCGLKGLGRTCADGTECLSRFCAQGVCCNSACNGSCQTCALSTALGTCSSVPDGAVDPQGTCQNKGAASCATDGLCDGKGACRLYAGGTQCAKPSCPTGGSTLTPAKTCDGNGNCVAAPAIACAPFLCNGATNQACNAACTADGDCLAPNICDPKTNLCGDKKRLGQTCAATADCLTGDFCVDGVCCGTSSCGACQACNVVGKAGACANVASGDAEPHARCAPQAPCGNTGSCDGAGACQQASAGVSCGTASCSGSTFTPVSHCTGDGACATATPSSCSPYVCGGSACLVACAGDGDCLAPFTCQGQPGAKSCALKKNGLACTTGGQCISGNCVDGVCCGSPACPACQACNLSGNGACSPVAAGAAAPAGFCSDQGSSSCGTNGKCDGNGGCQKYPDDTPCSTATCPANASTLTMAGACLNGVCNKPTQPCSPYTCNGAAACSSTCGSIQDCQSGYYCTGVGGKCLLKKDDGGSCATGDECVHGYCVDGVCCGTASCPSCKACNVPGSEGACSPMIPGSVDPNGTCTDQGPTSCGTNGKCDGNGGCQKYPDDTTCSQATCASTATLNLEGKCQGGSCLVTQHPCAPFQCASNACTSTCNVDMDCVSGYCTGPGGQCMAKKANGESCDPLKPTQCAFGNCVDGVCCDTACTSGCTSCALPATKGTCTIVAAGAADPHGVCKDLGAPACGTNGLCNGTLGGCVSYAAGTPCSTETCPAGTSNHTLAGACAAGSCGAATDNCNGFACDTNDTCRTTCSSDAQCAQPDYYCAGSVCAKKKDDGKSCALGDECVHGNCVESTCCGTASCNQCETCANTQGKCTLVDAGDPDPTLTCVNNAGTVGCSGTTGLCDGNGKCAMPGGSVMCAGKTCSDENHLTSDRFCDGNGGCDAGTITNCDAYKCDSTALACLSMCMDDGSCSSGNMCDGMSCVPIPPPM
ncbi:MAG TPA: hypothetical protein VHL80_15545 [Polyangia bacterium]|nr:hypothetical protein [Polyangia bacterium]